LIHGTGRSLFYPKTSLWTLERTETSAQWLPESLSPRIKRTVKFITNFHCVKLLRVSADIPTFSCMYSWRAMTNLQHHEHKSEGHRLFVFLISPSTVRNLLLPSERKPSSFRIGALLPFYATQKCYFNKSDALVTLYYHFADSKVCVGLVAPVEKFCASDAFIN
jgi:hypothetical protein